MTEVVYTPPKAEVGESQVISLLVSFVHFFLLFFLEERGPDMVNILRPSFDYNERRPNVIR